MIKFKITLLIFCVLTPCYVGAQNSKSKKKTITKQIVKVEKKEISDNESDNHPPMNSPIVKKLKNIDYSEIFEDYILIPNCGSELDEDGTVPTIDAPFSYVINVIDKDVIGANSLAEEVNTPLKRKHYLESSEYKTEYENLINERNVILNHDYFIESDFNCQFDLDEQCFKFELFNPNDYRLLIQSTDSNYNNYTGYFKTPAMSEDLAYKIETNKVKSFLIVGIKDKVNREYSEKIVLVPKKLYLAKTKDGSIFYEYDFKANVSESNAPTYKEETDKSNPIYSIVEEMPKYPGGESALLKDISENLVYPKNAWNNDVQGRVVVEFVIEKDGSIGDVLIYRGISPELNQAAIDAVKKLKHFEPGKQNGENVRVHYKFPVMFRIQ